MLNVYSDITTITTYLPVNRRAGSSSILLFCWKRRDLAALEPKDSNEKLLGKKIPRTDVQIRAGLQSPFRWTTARIGFISKDRGVKRQPDSVAIGSRWQETSPDLWESRPHPTDPPANGQVLCCHQCSLTQRSSEAHRFEKYRGVS